jgi:hypothetical protein
MSKSLEKIKPNKTEMEVWETWKKKAQPPIPLQEALKLYQLFLNSYEVHEIWRINGGKYSLGAIIDARERYEWENRKQEQLDSLYGNIEDKILKVKNDAVLHITDTLAAAHKIWGDKLKVFLQEGDVSVLEGLDLGNLKVYKDLLQMLQTLTNDSNKNHKEVAVGGTVNHVHTLLSEEKKLSGQDATKLLELMESKIENG